MPISRIVLLAAAAALAGAAPAGAVTGFGLAGPLFRDGPVLTSKTGSNGERTHTCQAGSGKGNSTAKSRLIGDGRKPAVVACEQPPKSELLTSGQLKQAAANAVAAIG